MREILTRIFYADIIVCVAQIATGLAYFYVYWKFGVEPFVLRWLLFTADGQFILFLNLPFIFTAYYIYLVFKNFSNIAYLPLAVINQALLYIICWLIFISALDKASILARGVGIDI